jgi:exonuclease SbcC
MCQFKIAEPSEKVFDYNLKNEKKKTLITLENFKNSIANTNFNQDLNTSIENIINDVAKNMSITQDIIDKAVDIYHEAFNNSPDKLEIQQGFIPDIQRKIIKRVSITNFQSHENTTIDFKDGLNTIIGESNSGKTSILRAIRWCLDNDPKGSDFITTGKDDCSVSVEFDDDTSITRVRTRNDSGKYIVVGKTIQPDGTASKWMQVYKGFANNLPVEIMNIHQMPKVNLTKDICIHLNMMSQLDGPFLVTESPQVKASVIGRLTGTQIIDLAIKDTNKTVLGNSKTIKTYLKEKQDREDELIKYQDLVYYEVYIRLYRSISYHIKNLFSIAEHICNLANEIEERINHIQEINNNIISTQNNIDMYQNMILIKQYIIDQSDIFDIQKEFKDTQNNINALEKRIKWLTIITSLKQFVDTFNIKVGLYAQLSNGYQKVLSLQQQIQTDTNNINNIGNDISIIESSKQHLSNIYNYMNVLSRDINSTKPLYDKAISRQSNILQYNNTLNISIEDINSYTEQISELTVQQEKIIQDNNICPCCGQRITAKKHVQNINNFMKGR